MIQISEVNIISIDKSDETWEIEGEIIFEGEFSTGFSVNYNSKYDEMEELEIETNPGKYDKSELKNLIIQSAFNYEEWEIRYTAVLNKKDASKPENAVFQVFSGL